MRHTADETFLQESRIYHLRFTCEACAHFVETTRSCAFDFPNAVHLSKPLGAGAEIVFCKSFELA